LHPIDEVCSGTVVSFVALPWRNAEGHYGPIRSGGTPQRGLALPALGAGGRHLLQHQEEAEMTVGAEFGGIQ